MGKILIIIFLLFLLSGCRIATEPNRQEQAPGTPPPAVDSSEEQVLQDPAPAGSSEEHSQKDAEVEVKLRCNPCMSSPEEWGEEEDHAPVGTETFWAEDKPKKLGPVAFGTLPHVELVVDPPLTIKEFKLDAGFPDVPEQLPVYMQGSYPKEHKQMLGKFVANPKRWEYHPAYSVLYDVGVEPISGPIESPTPEKIEAKAIELLGPLLMPDTKLKTTINNPDGSWTVAFERTFDGHVILSDRGVSVGFDAEGRAINIMIRRKPILEESDYPIRTPEQAYELLKSGGFKILYVEDFKPALSGEVDRFTVKEIEIAYHEQHPTQARLPLQPYYVFRNEAGQALYVPAVADPYV
ncbi:hypothetical protein [Paenibacillus thermotolerans]|uniref:hypothetical protein n=1 Tax=Paenibacillus thermotolerans TaxID=3027807 RepID=UPI0023681373|nr:MULTISPECIES: hypothetical protein [unclassified Paenibacillus]